MDMDTPRRIDSDGYSEMFEIGLSVEGYDRRVLHTVVDISHDGKVTITRTDNGYAQGNEDGSGWKPYVETQRVRLTANEMKMLIDAWQTVQTEEESRKAERNCDEVPF